MRMSMVEDDEDTEDYAKVAQLQAGVPPISSIVFFSERHQTRQQQVRTALRAFT